MAGVPFHSIERRSVNIYRKTKSDDSGTSKSIRDGRNTGLLSGTRTETRDFMPEKLLARPETSLGIGVPE